MNLFNEVRDALKQVVNLFDEVPVLFDKVNEAHEEVREDVVEILIVVIH